MSVITKKQLAEKWGVSERTVDQWRSDHGLPAVKIGNVLRFNEAEVMEWFMRFQKSKEPVGC